MSAEQENNYREGCFIRRPEGLKYLDELQNFNFVVRESDIINELVDKNNVDVLLNYGLHEEPINSFDAIRYFISAYEKGLYPSLDVLTYINKCFVKYADRMSRGESVTLDEVFNLTPIYFKTNAERKLKSDIVLEICFLRFYFNLKVEICYSIICELIIKNESKFNLGRILDSDSSMLNVDSNTIKDWYNKDFRGPQIFKTVKEIFLERQPYLSKSEAETFIAKYSKEGQDLIKNHSKNPRIK